VVDDVIVANKRIDAVTTVNIVTDDVVVTIGVEDTISIFAAIVVVVCDKINIIVSKTLNVRNATHLKTSVVYFDQTRN